MNFLNFLTFALYRCNELLWIPYWRAVVRIPKFSSKHALIACRSALKSICLDATFFCRADMAENKKNESKHNLYDLKMLYAIKNDDIWHLYML